MDQSQNQEDDDVSKLLQVLKNASKDLQNNPIFTSNNPHDESAKLLLDLHVKSQSLLSTNSNLSKLCQLLSNLKTLLEKLQKCQGYGLKSLLHRQVTNYKISQVAYAIEAEIQAYFDRESVQKLVKILEESETVEEKVKVKMLIGFTKRVSSQGFDRDFQDLILKAKVFSVLEMLLCDSSCSKRVREHAALAIAALASFNRNVFVGLVLMGSIIQNLISMESSCSIQVLSSLISIIRSPLIDEIHSRGEIPNIINLLNSENLSIKVAAIDCICQIAYFGRREVIEAMLAQDLIHKLMELQRSKHGKRLMKKDEFIDNESVVICEEADAKSGTTMEESESEEEIAIHDCPFSNCVARFAVQVEVGEGLSQKEKKEIKLEILKRVREASVSEAESATIVAEVLWGSSP